MAAAYITAVGEALPGQPVDNDSLARRLGISAEWIGMFVGSRSRHFAVDLDTGETTATLTDLCAAAGERALRRAATTLEAIDFVVLATATPDLLMPATVNMVADRLGLNQIPTYQVQSGCAGAVQALDIGRMLLASGHRAGLVVAGDTCRKHMDLDRDLRRLSPEELVNYLLFGDGAGAVVLSSAPAPGSMAVRTVLNRLTGLGRAPGQTIEWFGLAENPAVQRAFSEDYKAIQRRVPVMAREVVAELLDETGWEPGQVDYVLPPQLSARMTTEIVAQLGLDGAREISRVATTGNNGNALPFLQLRELADVMTAGQRALCIAVESSKWIKAAFAVEMPVIAP